MAVAAIPRARLCCWDLLSALKRITPEENHFTNTKNIPTQSSGLLDSEFSRPLLAQVDHARILSLVEIGRLTDDVLAAHMTDHRHKRQNALQGGARIASLGRAQGRTEGGQRGPLTRRGVREATSHRCRSTLGHRWEARRAEVPQGHTGEALHLS